MCVFLKVTDFFYKIMRIIGVFLLLLFISNSRADIVTGLYEAKVQVENQSSRVQSRAIQSALSKVLVKVSGKDQLLSNEQIKQTLKSARSFMRQYRYETRDGELNFIASFETDKVNDLIRDNGFPIWGRRRPATIVWFAHENLNQERVLYPEHFSGVEKQVILSTAEDRGINVVFPVLDITDIDLVNLYDVWGLFTDNILTASERYGVEVVLSIRMYYQKNELRALQSTSEPLTDGWRADWFVYESGKLTSGFATNPNSEILLASIINQLADKLAAEYSVTQSEQTDGPFQITVSNLASITEYVQVTRFFESLSAVSSASLTSISGQRAIFDVGLLGELSDFLYALQLDQKMRRKTDAFGRPTEDLEFEWRP